MVHVSLPTGARGALRNTLLVTLPGLVLACGPAMGGDDGVPLWADSLPAASVVGARRGMQPVRAILHVHSLWSHDACDKAPVDEQGRPNETCLQRFRAAACLARIDALFMTEHDRRMADAVSLEPLLLALGDDRPIATDGRLVASRIVCTDGRDGPILYPGAENKLAPIALDRLPPGDREQRRAFYDAESAGASDAFRDLGGVVLLTHPEDVPWSVIDMLDPDGIEIYNPHANFAPKHRRSQGLSGLGAIARLLPFYARTTNAHPDFALLALFHPNVTALDHWDMLLGDRMVFGYGGSDAHENTLPWRMSDGERGDSYTRMLPWSTNIVLVDVPVEGTGDQAVDDSQRARAIEAAVAGGQFFATLEAWGTPTGVDFRVDHSDGATTEMGGTTARAAGQRIVLEAPTVWGRAPAQAAPDIELRLYRIPAGGRRETVATGEDRIAIDDPAPGTYRAEVWITPHHLAPYLGWSAGRYIRPVPWVYTNPIRITTG